MSSLIDASPDFQTKVSVEEEEEAAFLQWFATEPAVAAV
jgi:hypothetical protein